MFFGLMSPYAVRGVRWPVMPSAQVTMLFPSVVHLGNLEFARLSVEFMPIMVWMCGVGCVVRLLFANVHALAMPTALCRPMVTLLGELRMFVPPMTTLGLSFVGRLVWLCMLVTRRWQCLRLTSVLVMLRLIMPRLCLRNSLVYVCLTLSVALATRTLTSRFRSESSGAPFDAPSVYVAVCLVGRYVEVDW